MWDRRAQLVSVTDGDTLKILLDQGYGDTKQVNARLNNARAPERGQVGYWQTKSFVEHWLGSRMDSEWPLVAVSIRIKDDSHERTTVGRYVFDVTCRGESLTEAINAFVKENGYPLGY